MATQLGAGQPCILTAAASATLYQSDYGAVSRSGFDKIHKPQARTSKVRPMALALRDISCWVAKCERS